MNTTFELKAQVSSEVFKNSTPKFPGGKREAKSIKQNAESRRQPFCDAGENERINRLINKNYRSINFALN
jgi:hypothetical protein